jgi:hypothetical protein
MIPFFLAARNSDIMLCSLREGCRFSMWCRISVGVDKRAHELLHNSTGATDWVYCPTADSWTHCPTAGCTVQQQTAGQQTADSWMHCPTAGCTVQQQTEQSGSVTVTRTTHGHVQQTEHSGSITVTHNTRACAARVGAKRRERRGIDDLACAHPQLNAPAP